MSVELLVTIAIAVGVWVFSAGVLYGELRALKRAVLNGLTTEQNRQREQLAEHESRLDVVDERCASRKEWIEGIEAKQDRMLEQGG